MRRLIESGAVNGRNFVQVGLRGYWPPVETFEWMQEQGLRWHLMREIEERGAEAVIDDAIAEALDGPDAIYISVDIDVVDPGHRARARARPSPAGMLPRELLRAVRRIVGAVELAGMDIVEVVAAVRPRRGDGDGREPGRARGDQRARGEDGRRASRSASSGRRREPPIGRAGDRSPPPTALARLYDLDLVEDPGDLDLYLALAGADRRPDPRARRRARGRLAVPLAAAGHEVTGVDLDPAMLARARAGADAAGPAAARRIRLVEADLLEPPPAGRRARSGWRSSP